MKRIRNSKHQATLNLPTIQLEGSLFLPDQLEKAAQGRAQSQTEVDYGVPKGVKLKDEYSRAFQIACAQWQHFAGQLDRADVDAHRLTVGFVSELLRDALGYAPIQPTTSVQVAAMAYPVHMVAGRMAVLVAPHKLALDDADPRFAVAGSGNRKKSAFQAMQELLNASPEHTWGIVSNGKQLRLLRDAASLTRPTYLEFDLADLLGGQRYAEFANVWRLLHGSRAPQSGAAACVWEQWREAGKAEGTRVRDGLRNGVEKALLTFGEGFLQHPANDALRAALHDGSLSKNAYFQQLLRLVYRLIFVFTVEERGVLHPLDNSAEALAARKAYAEGYALSRLREFCLKRRARNRHDDYWQAIRIVWRGLAHGQPRLALPALGGLFAEDQCPHLDTASLHNTHMLAALQHLRWAVIAQGKASSLTPVDYRNMGPEELGSVYESLLELVPTIDLPARQFGFAGITEEGGTANNARKTSGSYYTPDSLVQQLIKSALDPVIEQRLQARSDNPTEALLSIRVMDPACGSGHFLLAAARRLAERLAELRSVEGGQEGAVRPPDYRHALREVVARCIFGVDRNPMAIELARTALWLEGFEEGRPLGFLDHHLQVGDALLGLTDLKALEMGLPKDAFKPVSGDDKEVCKQLAKSNATALKDLEKKRDSRAFGQLDVGSQSGSGLSELQAIEALPENSAQETATKEGAYRAFLVQAKTSRLAHAAHMLVGAYLLPKNDQTREQIPTSATLYLTLQGTQLPLNHQGALAAAASACTDARVLHWPLAFPQVFASGGFDCVLGNPPWEVVQNRNDAEDENFNERQKKWFGEGIYSILSGRRDLYKLFLVLVPHLLNSYGRCGFILPVGFMFEDDCGDLRKNLFDTGSVISILHLQNGQKKFFPDVHASYRFLALTFSREIVNSHKFSTVLKSPFELESIPWCEVTRDKFDEIIGEERNAVIFNSRTLADTHSVLLSKLLRIKKLDYRVVAEFHASSDKDLLATVRRSEDDWKLLKNGSFHHFSPEFGPTEKWVSNVSVKERLERKGLDPVAWINHPRLVFRDIARNDDTRTLIPCLVPPGFVSTYDAPMLVPSSVEQHSELALAFYAGYLTSFLADFIVRPFVDKHIKGYVLSHVPIPEFNPDNALMFSTANLSLSLCRKSWLTHGQNSEPLVSLHSHPNRIVLEAMYLHMADAAHEEIRQMFSAFRSIEAEELSRYMEFRTLELVLREFDRLSLAKANGEPYDSVLEQPPAMQTGSSYSTHGVIRDEADAHLAGLILTIIHQAGRIPRRELTQALALAARPDLQGSFVNTQGLSLLRAFDQSHPGVFDSARLTGDRMHQWTRHFEALGVIRLHAANDLIERIQTVDLPAYARVTADTVPVAAVLAQAAAQAFAAMTKVDQGISATTPSMKQA